MVKYNKRFVKVHVVEERIVSVEADTDEEALELAKKHGSPIRVLTEKESVRHRMECAVTGYEYNSGLGEDWKIEDE